MPIIAKAGPNIIPAPAGSHSAVCCDVVDIGVVEVKYRDKTTSQHKIRIVWQIDEDRDDGKPFQVSKRYTLSLHEKSTLRKDLEAWRGKAFTQPELEGFDVEVLIGVTCLLSVIHNSQTGQTFANVNSIMRLPKGMPSVTVRDYVRVCDRDPKDDNPPVDQWTPTDDDVPF